MDVMRANCIQHFSAITTMTVPTTMATMPLGFHALTEMPPGFVMAMATMTTTMRPFTILRHIRLILLINRKFFANTNSEFAH
jgi:hypothetical protein